MSRCSLYRRARGLAGVRQAHASRVFWVLAAALVAVRLLLIGRFELYGDEAFYVSLARHLDWCFASNPPLIAVLISLGLSLKCSEFFVRLLPSLTGSAVAIALYLWGSARASRRVGLLANVLLLLTPIFWLLGLLATVDVPLVLCWLLATWALEEAAGGGSSRAWLVLGLALGIGITAKLLILLFAIPLAGVLLLPAGRRSLRGPWPWAGALAAVVTSAPVWVWNLTHDFATLRWRVQEHWGDLPGGLFASAGGGFLASQLVIWSPVVLIAATWSLAADLCRAIHERDTRGIVRSLSGLAPFAVFVLVAASGTDVHPYWTAVAGPAAALSLAARLDVLGARSGWLRASVAWTALAAPVALLAAALGVGLAGQAGILPLPEAVRAYASSRLAGPAESRRGLGTRARTMLDTLPAGSFLATADRFAPASLLAFYTDAAAGVQILHPTGLARQFAAWRPDDLAGRDAVVVLDRNDVAFPLAAYFDGGIWLDPVERETRLFIGRGFLGFATRAFDPLPPAAAGDLTRRLYRALFDREADPSGLAHAAGELARGRLRLIVHGMAQSPEMAPVAALPAPALIDHVVRALRDRPATTDEVARYDRVARWAGGPGVALRVIDAS